MGEQQIHSIPALSMWTPAWWRMPRPALCTLGASDGSSPRWPSRPRCLPFLSNASFGHLKSLGCSSAGTPIRVHEQFSAMCWHLRLFNGAHMWPTTCNAHV